MSATYRVDVTREDGNWLADVRGLAGAHTDARTLSALDRYVREVIVLVEDLPEEAASGLKIVFDFTTGDSAMDDATAGLREARARVAEASAQLQEQSEVTARELVRSGWSVRDVAKVLDVSPQRVSQLTAGIDRPARRRRAG